MSITEQPTEYRYMDESLLTDQFVAISRFAGARFDLLQAGGGNASVKLDNRRMLVKASGHHLSELQSGEGYAAVDYQEIIRILDASAEWASHDRHDRDKKVNHLVTQATLSPGGKASIEVFLHAVLGRFVLHTHPIAVNIIASQADWDVNIADLFADALCVPYRTPGIELGAELRAQIKRYAAAHGSLPGVVVLQNHGLIVSADSMDMVRNITEDVVEKCAKWCGVDLGRYQRATDIAEFVGDGTIAYLCEDRAISHYLDTQETLFFQKPYCPDSLVFCGVAPLVVDDLSDTSSLAAYREKYHEPPKVVIYDGQIYFLAKNIKKAREVEEVYKAHLLTLASMKGQISYLSDNELAYLCNWEAEKYRKNR